MEEILTEILRERPTPSGTQDPALLGSGVLAHLPVLGVCCYMEDLKDSGIEPQREYTFPILYFIHLKEEAI